MIREKRRRVLFICGSLNQTTQMHQIARELPDCEHAFTSYYCDAGRCFGYLRRERLEVDYRGRRGPYDLVVSCSDLLVQKNARAPRLVVVQEGILRLMPVQNGRAAANVAEVCRQVLAGSGARESATPPFAGLAMPQAAAS